MFDLAFQALNGAEEKAPKMKHSVEEDWDLLHLETASNVNA